MAPSSFRRRHSTRSTSAPSTTVEVAPPQPTAAAASKPARAPSGGGRGRRGARGGRGGKRSSSSSWQERCVTEEMVIDCEEEDEAAVSSSDDDEERAGRRGGGGGRGRGRPRRQGRQHQAAVALSALEEDSEEAVRQKEEADERELDLRIGQKLAEFDRAHWMGALQQARRLSPAQVAKELRELPLPQARIRRFAKAECTDATQTVHQEVHLLLGKACEMLIDDLAARGWVVAAESSRKCLQRCDIVTGRCKSDMFDFLVDVLPERLRLIKSKRGLNRSRAYQEMARLEQQGYLLPTAALPSLPFFPAAADTFQQQQAGAAAGGGGGGGGGNGLSPFVFIPYQHDAHHSPPPLSSLPLPPPFLMDPHALPMPPFTPDKATWGADGAGFFPAPNGRRPGGGEGEEEEDDDGAMLMPLPCSSPPPLPNLGDACMPSPLHHRRRLLRTPDSPMPDEHAPHFLASSPTSSSPFSASSASPLHAEPGPAFPPSAPTQQHEAAQRRLPSPRLVSPLATASTLLSLRPSPPPFSSFSSSSAAASSPCFDSACQTYAHSPSGLMGLALAAKAVGGPQVAPTGVGELEACGEAEREGAEGVLLLATKRRRKGL